MASPVDTSVKFFTDEMAGASVLSGSAGALITVLDACLVNGFGSKSLVSLVVAGGIATATFTGGASAAAPHSVILVAGVTGGMTDLNGEQKVLSVTTSTVTFATALADGTASGTITIKMAPLGWTKVYSGTNLAAYKSSDPLAHGGGMYLRVDDTGTTSGRLVGYETMSDINTGTGPFPTAAQMSGGGHWTKSNGANATAVRWTVVGDSRFFVFSGNGHVTATFGSSTRGFGDMLALRPSGDIFATGLSYGATAASFLGTFDYGNDSLIATPRSYAGLGSANLGRSLPYVGGAVISGNDSTLGAFPNPNDGALYMSRRYWTTAATQPPRGNIPGVLSVPQTVSVDTFLPRTVVPGSGEFAGRNFLVLSPSASAGSAGYVSLVDITGPWR